MKEAKRCKSCETEQELFNFSPNGRSAKGTTLYRSVCKSCRASKALNDRDTRLTSVCVCCGVSWRKQQGESRKDKNLCGSCYPMYRVAFNLNANAKHRAKKLGIDYDLDIDFIYNRIKQGKCERTGVNFSTEYNGKSFRDRSPYTPSIDKIDAKKGYTKDNVQFVCWWYNLSKSTFSDDEVLELCKKLVNHASLST